MNEFDQLLYETRFSTKETTDRIKVRYTDKELEELMKMPAMERQSLIEKYSGVNLSDEDLMRKELREYMSKIIPLICQEYGSFIPDDRLDKLRGMISSDSIIVIDDPEDSHDFSANSKKGQVIVNLAKVGKKDENPNPDIFTKMTSAKGSLPHELFHIVIQMLKQEEVADERMVINLSDGNMLDSRGMVGFMINEGFVEKFSSELCKKYELYHSIAPQYLPYVDICDYFMRVNPKINPKTIFSLDEADCIGSLSNDEQQKYYNAEAVSYAVRHGEKKAEDVVDSHIEKVDVDFDDVSEERLKELKTYYEKKKSKLSEMMQVESEYHI